MTRKIIGMMIATACLAGIANAQTIAFSGFETSAKQRILSGARSFQTTNGTATVDFDVIDTSAFTGPFELTIRLSGVSGNSTNGVDLSDALRAFVALNGSLFSDLRLIALNNDANEVWSVDDVTLTAVPEPSVYILLGVGLLFCGQRFLRRRRT